MRLLLSLSLFTVPGCLLLVKAPTVTAEAILAGDGEVENDWQDVSSFLLTTDKPHFDFDISEFSWTVNGWDALGNGWNVCAALADPSLYKFTDIDGEEPEVEWTFVSENGLACADDPDATLRDVIASFPKTIPYDGDASAVFDLSMDLSVVPPDEGNALRVDLSSGTIWDSFMIDGVPLVGDNNTVVSSLDASE